AALAHPASSLVPQYMQSTAGREFRVGTIAPITMVGGKRMSDVGTPGGCAGPEDAAAKKGGLLNDMLARPRARNPGGSGGGWASGWIGPRPEMCRSPCFWRYRYPGSDTLTKSIKEVHGRRPIHDRHYRLVLVCSQPMLTSYGRIHSRSLATTT